MHFVRCLAAFSAAVSRAFNAKADASEATDNASGICTGSNVEANSQVHQRYQGSNGSVHCASELWDAHRSLGKAGASASVAQVIDVWVDGCRPPEREACSRRARDPSMFFACAQEVLLDKRTLDKGRLGRRRLRLAFLFLRHAADLATKQVWESPPFLQEPMPCRQPAKELLEDPGMPKFGNELLEVPVVPGRMCNDGACAKDPCGLVVLDNAILSHEVEALISHGNTLLRRQEEENAGVTFAGEHDIVFRESAMYGSRKGHFLFIYILEKLRRLVSLAAGVPLSWVRIANHFLSHMATVENNELSEGEYAGNIHSDESMSVQFHNSAVLWLTPQDQSSGGEVEFWDADKKLWRRTVQPARGRVGLWSSGWENIHRVLPLSQQSQHARWSLPFFTSLKPPRYQPPPNVMLITKTCIFPGSNEQSGYCENRLWDFLSAADEDVV